MKLKRMRVLDTEEEIELSDIFDNKSIDEIILYLQTLQDKWAPKIYGEGCEVTFYTDYCGYDGGYELNLRCYRWETDAELEARQKKYDEAQEKKRLAAERKEARARKVIMDSEEKERAEYERLKAKFGE